MSLTTSCDVYTQDRCKFFTLPHKPIQRGCHRSPSFVFPPLSNPLISFYHQRACLHTMQ
ncbi:hypothetical protein PHET_08954 [Paragonimus heterotremus]|uniref:Uncharacterized protein n=1 Tax=Paragonimus heterotremus TaxID=100268 RepID=A0A8J4T4U3_9TREM|nr:hypothetical protein PHET_08954 [Paragonimus heterotremus]